LQRNAGGILRNVRDAGLAALGEILGIHGRDRQRRVLHVLRTELRRDDDFLQPAGIGLA
jgi:hypothetical protein